MRARADQPFPAGACPDPLLCWLWLAHVMGPASLHAGRVLDAFGGAQEAWEARDTEEFRQAAGLAAAKGGQHACGKVPRAGDAVRCPGGAHPAL